MCERYLHLCSIDAQDVDGNLSDNKRATRLPWSFGGPLVLLQTLGTVIYTLTIVPWPSWLKPLLVEMPRTCGAGREHDVGLGGARLDRLDAVLDDVAWDDTDRRTGSLVASGVELGDGDRGTATGVG